jgi:hypothetical protein
MTSNDVGSGTQRCADTFNNNNRKTSAITVGFHHSKFCRGGVSTVRISYVYASLYCCPSGRHVPVTLIHLRVVIVEGVYVNVF